MPLFFARSAKRRPHKVARRPGNAALQSGANRVEPTGAVVREARERRPPVGTARRRRANHVLPTGGVSRTRTAAPVEVPVAVRTMPLLEVRPARRATARLCRPPPGELARGRRSLYLSQRPRGRFQTASQQWPIRREYRGVPSALPARRRADRTPIPTFPTPPSAPLPDKIPGPAGWAMGGTIGGSQPRGSEFPGAVPTHC